MIMIGYYVGFAKARSFEKYLVLAASCKQRSGALDSFLRLSTHPIKFNYP